MRCTFLLKIWDEKEGRTDEWENREGMKKEKRKQ